MKSSALFMILVLVFCAVVLVAESAPSTPRRRAGQKRKDAEEHHQLSAKYSRDNLDIIFAFFQLTVNKYQMNPSRLLTMCILAGF
ncbi:hypothetical protein CEXT_180641 [Caerostris extrusa]|uniref:Uncharacterized protein n=1 Tax=Caerostris extrusa TaxID=172846 RepID=A0AAV4XK95_CAEEX|nr:hypothetical protein CEXT_180641 [Caerostris extrusa]